MPEEPVEVAVDNPTGDDTGSPNQPTYDELKAELDAAKQQSQKFSTALHTATKRLDRLEKAAMAVPDIEAHITAKDPEPKKERVQPQQAEVDKGLLERMERLERREAEAQRRDRLSAIRGALEENGLDANRARRFSHVIDREQSDRIAVGDDGRVAIQDGEGQVGIGDWMKAYLQTDDGRVFLPPKQASTTRVNGSATATGKKVISAAEYGALSLEEISSGNYEIG
jgi:DNA repair exonuclease SbcCD ATPase subunit